MNKLCISIRGFKRPDYSKQCLDSLVANTDLDGVDFYFFQDGAVNPFSGIRHATDEEVEASLRVFQESDLPNKTIYQSEVNMGAALRNKHQLATLFPKYEYVVLADNDLVFNKHYIKTLKVLFRQFGEDRKAGVIQTSFRHEGVYQGEEKAKKLEDKVAYGFSHFCEMGFWRKSWKRIKHKIRPYFQLTKRCDFRELLLNPSTYPIVKKRLREIYGSFRNGSSVTTEDYALAKSARMAGYKGLHTLTLRYRIIGQKGHYSFRGNRWEQEGFGGIELHDIGDVDKYVIEEKP